MLINGDTGEDYSSADFIPLLDIANIACGGHAGNEQTMTQAVLLCKTYKVRVSAHISYKDRKNFGRKSIFGSSAQLKKELEDNDDVQEVYTNFEPSIKIQEQLGED